MKFVRFYYLLTFIFTRDNRVESGEFSQEDLRFISDRLYPTECFKLLNIFPGKRISKTSQTDNGRFNDDLLTENSRIQCLDALIECNESGKKRGCTKIWLEGALRKLGRADLVSRLMKRWKKATKRKNISHKSKQPKKVHSDKKDHRDSRKSIVTFRPRDAIKYNKKRSEDDFWGQRIIIILVAGSLLIIIFLGCIMIVSYRRACRCYKNYLAEFNFTDQKTSINKSFDTSETRRLIDSPSNNVMEDEELPKVLDEESANKEIDDLLWSDELVDTHNATKIESLDSPVETDEPKCNCGLLEKNRKSQLSPCAKLKHFFDSPKRLLQGKKDIKSNRRNKYTETPKIRKNVRISSILKNSIDEEDNNDKKIVKHKKRKSKKSTSRRGKQKTVRSNCKTKAGEKPAGCTCEMCKLFNITGEKECSEKTMLMRRRKRLQT